ncbi:Multidrug resistance-associated protein 5 [Frankliniella fusca]|uniref:Multidrug resistance-associated protein 5 n=1 Tax=Frankliniella fusca TaxID=407009 RepID=A0AAE1L877_9NEOP|nr:Multidrug resistance-associated protein 5 [Frankliniella fusca]
MNENEKPISTLSASIGRASYDVNRQNGFHRTKPRKTGCGKYADALRVLLPCRPGSKNKNSMPANKAGLFSFITINWLTRMMWKTFRKGLTEEDFYDLADADDATESARRLESIWGRRVGKQGAATSLGSAVWRFIRTRTIISMVLMAISIVLQFVGPAILQKMILAFVEDKSEPLWYGLVLILGLFLSQLCRNLFFGMAYVINMHTATRLQGGLQHLVFNKVLKLRAIDDRALGQVVTFCSSEQERMFDAIHMGTITVGSPVMFILAVAYSWWLMGAYALIGNLIILLFYPIMGVVAALTSRVRTNTVVLTDKRINIMSEILNSIKLIKMYAWEDSFADNVKDVRELERVQLQRAAFLQSFSSTISPSITILAAICTFIAYTLTDHELVSQTAFTVYSVFNALQFTVAFLPYGIKSITEARVSFKKMEKFLLKPDMTTHSDKYIPVFNSGDTALGLKLASFVWDEVDAPAVDNTAFEGDNNEAAALRNINMTVKKGALIGVCGSVGSGKTSLLSAITGGMICVSGDLQVNGSVAIVSQQAWIFNETLRENIIFGLPYDETRYRRTIEVCSLQRDLELLPKADMTEIGERGSNLSGGQKQRVNLARAVYADKDIVLLDDPLSAVDARVAKHIFDKCIKGALAGKTVLLVTHGIQFLEECDEILYMKNGVVSERGTHEQLKAKGGDYTHMLSYDQNREKKDKDKKEDVADVKDLDEEPPMDVVGGTLTAVEAHKSLGFRAYIDYFKFCGGVCIMLILFILIMAFVLSQLFAGLWLQIWLDFGDGKEGEERGTNILNNPNLHTYQIIYGSTFILMMVTGSIKGFGFARQLVLASSKMHDTMFRKVMRCPVAFFDVTPVGRILQRFSKDMDELDVRIPYYLEYVGQGMITCIGQMIMVCIMYPLFSVVLVVAIGIFSFLEVWLNRGLQQSKSLDSIRKAPVLSHLSSTMAGLNVIRTYGRQDVQLLRFRRRLNRSLASDLIYRSSVRWFTFRMDMICVVLVVLTALVTVLLRNDASSAKSGLALSSVFAVCNIIPFVMQMASELQARFTSVERVLEYTSGLTEEAPRRLPNSPKFKQWPVRGDVSMQDVELRYREGLPLVLQKVNADIRGGEKIGVVGRTGAGKSSLINTLLRFQELAGGRILIDDVDIAKVGLHDLRSSIAIIPQDPVLFEGTMRFNLDPFEDFSDEQIWEALEKSHVKEKVAREEKQLLTPISGGGQNLSVGEKQLICLARAVLRRNKILLLDEATASVDVETDFLIQRTIREAFHDCTVLTIAHRLHTVATYDRVMVLDAGKVIEFDTPANLLGDPNSVFRQMSEAAGVTAETMAASP